MSKPKIGILTTFTDLNPSYSLCSVVESQLTALIKYNYPVVLFVHDNFDAKGVPKEVEIRKVVPRFSLVDYSSFQKPKEDFEFQVQKIVDVLQKNIADINIIFEHDLIFQGWFLPYCVAIHRLAEKNPIKWFHWIHSVPNPPPPNCQYPHNLRFTLPPNSKLVYLNHHNIIRVAESYQTYINNVKVVYNPVDPRLLFDLHPLVKSIVDKYNLLDADFIQTYPLSTPRMSAKQLDKVIEIFAQLKKLGKSVRLVVANAHANAEAEKQQIENTISFAKEKGLSEGEIIFTSLQDVEYELEIPRKAVADLFRLSNIFIFPSLSENCPLILLEAMSAGNLLVLNDSVGAMRELAGDAAIYFKFGSIDEQVSYADYNRFMEDVAKIIIAEFQNNRALLGLNRVKQRFNYDWIFRNQIEPLLYKYGD